MQRFKLGPFFYGVVPYLKTVLMTALHPYYDFQVSCISLTEAHGFPATLFATGFHDLSVSYL